MNKTSMKKPWSRFRLSGPLTAALLTPPLWACGPEAPRDVPAPPGVAVVGVGLAAMAWMRGSRKGRGRCSG